MKIQKQIKILRILILKRGKRFWDADALRKQFIAFGSLLGEK